MNCALSNTSVVIELTGVALAALLALCVCREELDELILDKVRVVACENTLNADNDYRLAEHFRFEERFESI